MWLGLSGGNADPGVDFERVLGIGAPILLLATLVFSKAIAHLNINILLLYVRLIQLELQTAWQKRAYGITQLIIKSVAML